MPAPSIKKRYSPSGPPFTDNGDNTFKYINNVEFPAYTFVGDPGTVESSVLISGIDHTYQLLVNPVTQNEGVNNWMNGEAYSIAYWYIDAGAPTVINLIDYYTVVIGMLSSETNAQPNDITVVADLMFFKEGELVTQGIVPP